MVMFILYYLYSNIMPFILQTNGLTKKIGSKTLVTDVNIHIPKGEIYGFLGPNGA